MDEGAKITAVQFRSEAGRSKRTKATLRALGLGKIGARRDFILNPALAGMLKKVRHLVAVEKK